MTLIPGPSADELNLKMLMGSVPGTPGEDYPILSEVPETAFSCKGQKVGGESEILNLGQKF
jgi:hypothetical protein